MRFERFFTRLFCKPVLLEAGARIGYERALLTLMDGGSMAEAGNLVQASIELRKQDPTRAQKRTEGIMEMNGATALIHMDGAIDKHLSAMEAMCFDATDLNDVDRALARAEADSSISNVLLLFNSPGGSVTGVPETGARIAALAQKKNVFAYTDAMCCSAAYWLASQADQIFSTASAQVGSIGVYLALIDQTRALEERGVKVETIKDGKLKAAGAPWKPLTEDERAHLQAQVNQIGSLFRSAVNAKRPGVSMDTMQGQSFFGEAALTAGLVDAIVPDLSAALAQF